MQTKKITVKEYYNNNLGTEVWNGYYYVDIDISNDIILYGDIISAEIITSNRNLPVFSQYISAATNCVRLLSTVSGCTNVGVRVVYIKR